MITVLIADDDFWTREGLKSTINWNEIGFDIIAEAADANTAYNLFKENKPQLVITDIRMEQTNGLDLVSKIHAEYPDTEFIILSGYSQFDYAKRAFENGSSAYLLKPVDNTELKNVLMSIKEKIENRQNQNLRLNVIDDELPKLKTIFYNEIINNEVSDGTLLENSKIYGINPYISYILIDAGLSHVAISDMESSSGIIADIMECLSEFNKQTESLSDYWAFSKFNVLAIMKCEKDLPVDCINALKDFLQQKTGRLLTIGVSSVYDFLGDLKDAYLEADEALSFKSLYGSGAVILYQNISLKKRQTVSISSGKTDEIVHAIFSVDYNHAISIADEIFSGFKKYDRIDIAELQSSVAEMITIILRNVYKDKQTITNAFSEKFRPFLEISKCETIDDIHSFFIWVINKIFETPNLYLECSYHPQVQEIISYITKNYSSPLTVKSVAESNHLSPSYFMYIFKRETGKTFHAYLTEYRIKIAIQLLKTHNYKIYEVADMVGFSDAERFGKVFKSIMGCPPTKYL